MDDRPNVTVVYQTAPARPPGLGAVLLELLTLLAILGVGALIAGFLW